MGRLLGSRAPLVVAGLGLAVSAHVFAGTAKVTRVATSAHVWTGVAVSRGGRVFVNFPRWSENVPISVGELGPGGAVRPYPNVSLNHWKVGDDPGAAFVCVQSVTVDGKDRLWILDAGNPWLRGVVPGGAKLIQVDLASNSVARMISFDEGVAPAKAYLNDVRVDVKTETAFITESGLGAIIVVDLGTGTARRLLADDPSTKAEAIEFKVGGRAVAAKINADGIALDRDGEWLYYQALTGRTLYRVRTSALRDPRLAPEKLAAAVNRFASTCVADGLQFTPSGIVVSALEDDGIKLVTSQGKLRTLVTDPQFQWPDSFALGPDGSVWFTTSQLHLGPNPPTPYGLFKLSPSVLEK